MSGVRVEGGNGRFGCLLGAAARQLPDPHDLAAPDASGKVSAHPLLDPRWPGLLIPESSTE